VTALRVLALTVLFVTACGSRGDSAGSATKPASDPVTVRLVPAVSVGMPLEIPAQGILEAQDELRLGFQVGGRLGTVGVDVGDPVQPGTKLAELDSRDFELGLARAEAALDEARARLGIEGPLQELPGVEEFAIVREAAAVLAEAELQRDRMEELVNQSMRSRSDLDTAKVVLDVARSRLQKARDDVQTWIAVRRSKQVELEVARKRLLDSVLLSPFEGRVAARKATAGQFLEPGAEVLTLLRTDSLRLRMHVSDLVAGDVRIGQKVVFQVDGQGASTFEGTVSRMLPSISRDNRTVMVEAAVPNGDGKLVPGGFARARIRISESAPVTLVPRAAVASFAGISRVFRVVDGRATGVQVTLGRVHEDQVEVGSGIEPGALLVADPKGLVNGTPVRVQE